MKTNQEKTLEYGFDLCLHQISSLFGFGPINRSNTEKNVNVFG